MNAGIEEDAAGIATKPSFVSTEFLGKKEFIDAGLGVLKVSKAGETCTADPAARCVEHSDPLSNLVLCYGRDTSSLQCKPTAQK